MTPTCTEEVASQEAKHPSVDACGGIVEYEQDNGKINKTISDGGITIDFSIIKVHTSN